MPDNISFTKTNNKKIQRYCLK